jgi:SAM-dependent methyltransferase
MADRLIDATARRPAGWLARKTYGGTLGAPKGHEAIFDQVLDAAGSLEGARCLDVGCGGGRLLERVLSAGTARAAGLDHSPDMLSLSRERNREAVECGVLELELGDATQTELGCGGTRVFAPWLSRLSCWACHGRVGVCMGAIEEAEDGVEGEAPTWALVG